MNKICINETWSWGRKLFFFLCILILNYVPWAKHLLEPSILISESNSPKLTIGSHLEHIHSYILCWRRVICQTRWIYYFASTYYWLHHPNKYLRLKRVYIGWLWHSRFIYAINGYRFLKCVQIRNATLNLKPTTSRSLIRKQSTYLKVCSWKCLQLISHPHIEEPQTRLT